MSKFSGVKFGLMGAGPDRNVADVVAGAENVVTGRKLHFNATPILADGTTLEGHLSSERALEVFGSDDPSDEFFQPMARVHILDERRERVGSLDYRPGTGAEEYINIGSRHDDFGCTPTVKTFKECDLEVWGVLRDVPAYDYEYRGVEAGEEHESKHIFVNVRGSFRKGRGEG